MAHARTLIMVPLMRVAQCFVNRKSMGTRLSRQRTLPAQYSMHLLVPAETTFLKACRTKCTAAQARAGSSLSVNDV